MTPNRLLLVAQSPVWRFALQTVVQSCAPEVEAAAADHSLAAFSVAPRFLPDLTIIQDALPGVSGMIAARMIRQLAPESHVLVLADDVDLAMSVAGESTAVDAVLPSASEPDELIAAIGGFERRQLKISPAHETAPLDIALLDGVSRGMSLEAIAAAIGATVAELSGGLSRLLHEFGASDPTTLVSRAIGRGWIDLHVRVPRGEQAISFAVAA